MTIDPLPVSTSAPAAPRRGEILRAATTLFAEYGYHAVGMRAIADAVGVRSSSLYHHFPSKHALLAAIASEHSHAFAAAHLPILEGDAPPQERLRQVLREQIIFYWRHGLESEVGLRELRELERYEPAVYQQIQEDRRRYQQAVDRAIEQGVDEGVFSAVNAPLVARAIIGMTLSVNDWFQPDKRMTIEEVADRYADFAVGRLLTS